MAITVAYEMDGVTVGATPISLVSGTTTVSDTAESGVFQIWIDTSTIAKADEFLLTISEKVEATGGTRRTCMTQTFLGVQGQIWFSPTLILMHGWNATLTKVAGTDRAFDTNIRKIA